MVKTVDIFTGPCGGGPFICPLLPIQLLVIAAVASRMKTRAGYVKCASISKNLFVAKFINIFRDALVRC